MKECTSHTKSSPTKTGQHVFRMPSASASGSVAVRFTVILGMMKLNIPAPGDQLLHLVKTLNFNVLDRPVGNLSTGHHDTVFQSRSFVISPYTLLEFPRLNCHVMAATRYCKMHACDAGHPVLLTGGVRKQRSMFVACNIKYRAYSILRRQNYKLIHSMTCKLTMFF